MIEYLESNFKPQPPKKFYFLEYFYVLLKSIQTYSDKERIFDEFVTLKNQYQLGLSRYKKLTDEGQNSRRIGQYTYTFDQVLGEAELYGLVSSTADEITLTELGLVALQSFDVHDAIEFNALLFELMEKEYQAPFRYLVEMSYSSNPDKHGLLIFPIYSPYRLGFKKAEIKTAGDIQRYYKLLQQRLEEDIKKYLDVDLSLDNYNMDLISSLIEAGLISRSPDEPFDTSKYNAIIKRGRDYWLRYFLQELYKYELSLNSFDIWAYRAKQVGLVHITEFYPDPAYNGRIVYPLSVVRDSTNSQNFRKLAEYSDGKQIFLHLPEWGDGDEFVEALYKAYVETRQVSRNYFVSLANVRERVCYNMKIPEFHFDKFLGYAYRRRSQLKVKISLEVDKLPVDTSLTYIHREPIMIEGKLRNIIAIDLA